MYFFSFCLSPCQFHSLTYSSCWQHFYISKTPSSVEKKNLPFPMTIRKSPGSYSYSRSVTNSSLNRSLKPKGRCAIRGRLAQVMTWFPEDRLPLGRLSPRLRLKGSLFCCCQYSLTRTGHIAPLNHRGQGSTILSFPLMCRNRVFWQIALTNAKSTIWLKSNTHLDLGVGPTPPQLITCRFSQKT